MRILRSQFFAGATSNLHELCLSETDSLADKVSSEKPVQMKKIVTWVPLTTFSWNNILAQPETYQHTYVVEVNVLQRSEGICKWKIAMVSHQHM